VFETASSIEDWIRLARQANAAAYLLVEHEPTRNAAWAQADFACECIVKASIMASKRLSTFPSRRESPELFDHDLQRLAQVLGFTVDPDDEVAPAWAVVVQWRREHTYVDKIIPEIVVRDLLKAAFSAEGLVPWMCRTFLRNHMTPEANIWAG
jgi:hypothetical protein